MDENTQPQALTPESGAETTPVAPPAADEQTAQQTEEVTPEQSNSAAEPQTPAKQPESQKRIRELAKERNELREQLETYQSQNPQAPLQTDEYGNVDINQLQQSQAHTAQTMAQLEVQKLRQEIDFSNDLRVVESQHPKLNPDSPEYDKDYDDRISSLYAKTGGNIKLSDFVAGIESVARSRAQTAQAQAAATLARQAAEGGLTPSGDDRPVPTTNSLADIKAKAVETGNFDEYFKASAMATINKQR